MAGWLRQSTEITLRIGPFLDRKDGVTEEVALAGSGTEISKAGAAFAAGPTLGTHDAEGWYLVTLTAPHLNTLGSLRMKVQNSAIHLPVWESWMVLSANVYDSLVAGSDVLDVSVTQLAGVAQSLTDLKDFADDGYDPSTNKVQGVVLVDTLTTYTGNTLQTGDSFARLGAPAGASVSADVAAADDATLAAIAALNNLSAAQVNAEVDTALADVGVTTTVTGRIDAAISTRLATASYTAPDNTSIADILTDTGTMLPATLATIAAYIDTEVAAIKAKTDALPASPAAVGSAMTLATDAVSAAALATDAVNEITAAIKALVVESEGNYTVGEVLSLVLAACAGVTDDSGATLKTPNGNATRITATIASNERTAMTLTPSS